MLVSILLNIFVLFSNVIVYSFDSKDKSLNPKHVPYSNKIYIEINVCIINMEAKTKFYFIDI